jgi:hypothetical protein
MFRRGIKGESVLGAVVCWVVLGCWLVGGGLVFVVNTLWKLYSCLLCIIINFYISEEGIVVVGQSRDCG